MHFLYENPTPSLEKLGGLTWKGAFLISKFSKHPTTFETPKVGKVQLPLFKEMGLELWVNWQFCYYILLANFRFFAFFSENKLPRVLKKKVGTTTQVEKFDNVSFQMGPETWNPAIKKLVFCVHQVTRPWCHVTFQSNCHFVLYNLNFLSHAKLLK